MAAANAVELTTEAAWFIADEVGAGSFPWVLAITVPFTDDAERGAFAERQREQLRRLQVIGADGTISASVARWVSAVCFPQRWLELRFVGRSGHADEVLRGVVAQRDGRVVVALRSGGLITLSAMDIVDPAGLVPVVTAGLPGAAPARFPEFALPARAGARADERLRRGAPVTEVVAELGIPRGARDVVAAVYTGQRSYAEIVAGGRGEGTEATTEVGLGIVDSAQGRILVTPTRANDGQWVSTFTPGTPLAIARALDELTATLATGHWFEKARLTRDFAV